MRISADRADPGYANFEASMAAEKKPIIYLDGVKQEDVITADTDQGFIVVLGTDDAGGILRDPKDSNAVLTIRKEGRVSVVLAEKSA